MFWSWGERAGEPVGPRRSGREQSRAEQRLCYVWMGSDTNTTGTRIQSLALRIRTSKALEQTSSSFDLGPMVKYLMVYAMIGQVYSVGAVGTDAKIKLFDLPPQLGRDKADEDAQWIDGDGVDVWEVWGRNVLETIKDDKIAGLWYTVSLHLSISLPIKGSS